MHAGTPVGRGLAALRETPAGALILAAAIPLLFLHSSFQPSISVTLGGSSATAYLSDFAVLAVVLAALVRVAREGLDALRPGRTLWTVGALLFVWIAAEVALGRAHTPGYSLSDHGVSAAKLFEYGLLAPSVAVLARRRRELLPLLWSFTIWSCTATVVGVLQFFGVPVADASPTVGHRQTSFLSSADFAALSGAGLLIGVVAVALPRLGLGRTLGRTASATGAIGLVVAASVASALGLATALATLAVVLLLTGDLPRRRLAAVATIGVLVVAGTVAIRGSDLEAFGHFLGASTRAQAKETHVQTYTHRTLLSWMGYRMWLDRPLLGVGWEGSADPAVFVPYLPALHARFPGEPPLAFPADAPGRHYGVQDAWIESLSDLGVPGFLLWVGMFAAAAWLGARATLRRTQAAPAIGLLGVALLVWLWAAQGFVAGIPLDALTFVVFGLVATREPEEAAA